MATKNKARSKSKAQARKARANFLASTALAVVVGAAITGISFYGKGGPARDAQGCRVQPTEMTVLAIDKTAQYTEAQWNEAWSLVERADAELKPDEALRVYVLTEKTAIKPELIAQTCGTSIQSSDGITGPTEAYIRRQKIEARERLLHDLGDIGSPRVSPFASTSRGFEAIARLPDVRRVARNGSVRLAIYSDFLERVSPNARPRAGTLENFNVELVLAENSAELHRQDRELYGAWVEHFAEGGAYVEPRWTRVESDEPLPRDSDGCPMRPKNEVLVLLDATDPFPDSQIDVFRNLVTDEANSLEEGEVLEVYALQEHVSSYAGSPVARYCLTEGNSRTSRRKLVERVNSDLGDIVQLPKHANSSPIMENISAILRRRTLAPGSRVEFFSDMLFNSDFIDFFDNGKLHFPEFAARSGAKQSFVDFGGAEVRVHYAVRQKAGWAAMQNDTHQQFIVDWLQAQKASVNAQDIYVVPDGQTSFTEKKSVDAG